MLPLMFVFLPGWLLFISCMLRAGTLPLVAVSVKRLLNLC